MSDETVAKAAELADAVVAKAVETKSMDAADAANIASAVVARATIAAEAVVNKAIDAAESIVAKAADAAELSVKTMAKAAVMEVLVTLGVDAHDPKALLEMQKDFAHIRTWRESVETVKTQSIKTAVGVIVAGICGAVYAFWKVH